MVKRSKAVSCPQRAIRLMSVVLTGTGTAALSGICANDMTLTDNGTGDYTITFDNAYSQAPQVLVTPETDNIICKVTASSTTACTVKSENLSGSATDAVMHVVIIGSDTADQI